MEIRNTNSRRIRMDLPLSTPAELRLPFVLLFDLNQNDRI